jgi:tetratricopeptide (TPR) repeat protein
LFVLFASAAGCYWSVRLGWADWLSRGTTLAGARKSVELAPGNSVYLEHAADVTEAFGGNGTALRERAALANPLDSANWIRLATRAEIENRGEEAERDLLRAYEADRQFEPRWSLANFYFRRGDRERALQWSRKTLEFGSGDLNAVFQLLWNVSGNGTEILEKAIPSRPLVLGQYLQYLDASGRLGEASGAAQTLLPLAGPEQQDALAIHCSRCLDSGRVDEAVAVWNGMIARGLLSGDPIKPETGKPLENADFARMFSGLGFDWGAPQVEDVAVQRQPATSSIRIGFYAHAPENCGILGEYIVLSPRRKYRLQYRYETTGMSGAGMRWVISDHATRTVLTSLGPPEAADSTEHTVEATFETPPTCRLATIELRYDRELGTVRPQGSIRFSHLDLEFAP